MNAPLTTFTLTQRNNTSITQPTVQNNSFAIFDGQIFTKLSKALKAGLFYGIPLEIARCLPVSTAAPEPHHTTSMESKALPNNGISATNLLLSAAVVSLIFLCVWRKKNRDGNSQGVFSNQVTPIAPKSNPPVIDTTSINNNNTLNSIYKMFFLKTVAAGRYSKIEKYPPEALRLRLECCHHILRIFEYKAMHPQLIEKKTIPSQATETIIENVSSEQLKQKLASLPASAAKIIMGPEIYQNINWICSLNSPKDGYELYKKRMEEFQDPKIWESENSEDQKAALEVQKEALKDLDITYQYFNYWVIAYLDIKDECATLDEVEKVNFCEDCFLELKNTVSNKI
jgi:hypothetical protein